MINRSSILLMLCAVAFVSPIALAEQTGDAFEGHVPRMKIENVIRAAREHVKKKEIKVENFFVQTVRYDSSQGKWFLLFNGNIPMPGNNFMIWIEDKTGETGLMPGL